MKTDESLRFLEIPDADPPFLCGYEVTILLLDSSDRNLRISGATYI